MKKFEEFLSEHPAKWMIGDQEHGDIIMSTRVRLARNIENMHFPRAASEEDILSVDRSVSGAILDDENLSYQFSHFDLSDKTPIQKQVLVEKHLISPQLANQNKHGSVLISEDESISIMINEEDHIRIQCIEPGLDFTEALRRANEIDDCLEHNLSYAFDERFGYKTTCPTNVGTGLRASAMLHLPALTMTKQMRQLITMMPRLGLVVRGMYGEGTEATGSYYQISNQVTLGKSEEEIVQELESIVLQIINKEIEAREAMLEYASIAISDRLNRSLGVLQYARILTSEEAATCLSNVRLGIDLGIIQSIPNELLNKCMLIMQSGFLQQIAGTSLKANERDVFRAELIRDIFQQCGVLNNNNGDKGEDSYDV